MFSSPLTTILLEQRNELNALKCGIHFFHCIRLQRTLWYRFSSLEWLKYMEQWERGTCSKRVSSYSVDVVFFDCPISRLNNFALSSKRQDPRGWEEQVAYSSWLFLVVQLRVFSCRSQGRLAGGWEEQVASTSWLSRHCSCGSSPPVQSCHHHLQSHWFI